ncbi:MAG: RNA polymerase sigma factor [Candidatus Aminicenantes bacterium]|nr:RNA polymerase sigma factor [Candidatus Aminicenantes bacterium]
MIELIAGLKKKDETAFKKVMSMYKNQVFNYLNQMLGDKGLAEEITQDTFVKVYFKASHLRTENLKAWIYKIATNLARSEFRKRKIKHFLSLSEVSEAQCAYEPAVGNEIMLEQMLSKLPDKYRIPLVMRELNNFSFEEMADILKKPIGTVKSLVFRGRQQVKSTLMLPGGGLHG